MWIQSITEIQAIQGIENAPEDLLDQNYSLCDFI